MFNPSKPRRPVSRTSFAAACVTDISLVAAVLVVVAVPFLGNATAGVQPGERRNPLDSPAPAASAPAEAQNATCLVRASQPDPRAGATR